MAGGSYYIPSSKEEIKLNVHELSKPATHWRTELEADIVQGFESNSFWKFYKAFNELHATSIHYMKKAEQDKLKAIREMLKKPNPSKPKELIEAYDRYYGILVSSGLLEVGYQEPDFREKMLNKT